MPVVSRKCFFSRRHNAIMEGSAQLHLISINCTDRKSPPQNATTLELSYPLMSTDVLSTCQLLVPCEMAVQYQYL